MNTSVLHAVAAISLLLVAASCLNQNSTKIAGVMIRFPGSNVLQAQVSVQTTAVGNACIKYRIAGGIEKTIVTDTSEQKKEHLFLLNNLEPGQQYVFNVITSTGKVTSESRDYHFRTMTSAAGTQNAFRVSCTDTSGLPQAFKQGFVMVHRRETPGAIVILNHKGEIVWHQQAQETGFKVVHFTQNKTLLCLLGTKEYETSYGAAILELSMAGDTLLYLKKGQNDFQQTIHHEVLTNNKNELVTLCVEEKIMDLRSKGGMEKDTVRGDGILVLDRQGRKKWGWTVFDALDPLKDKNIVQNKKDWMHANSLCFDRDGNYLISFYNNSQIWKVNAASGKVIWKLGKGGDFEMPNGSYFDQAHAVHINERGWLQFFDNGTDKKISGTLALLLNESARKAQPVIGARLLPHFFSDRMGSSYLVGNTSLLQCVSKHKTVVLTNFNGNILWQLWSGGFNSYRATFIPGDVLTPYLMN